MKTLLASIILLLSLSVQAASFKATVIDSFCGEMDPFAVGDVCLLNVEREDNGKKLSIVLDFDTFATDEFELEGKTVLVDDNYLDNIRNRNALNVLLDYDRDYYYMEGSEDSFRVVNNSTSYEMKKFIKKIGNGYFSIRRLPEGYTSKEIERPELTDNFKAYLKGATSGKLNDWEDLVWNSGEYDHLSGSEREEIAGNPWKEMGVKYLLEISEVHQILKKGKIIGYYMDVSDHVQAAIYQDGAWIEMLFHLGCSRPKSLSIKPQEIGSTCPKHQERIDPSREHHHFIL